MQSRDRNIANTLLGSLELYTGVVWLGKHVFQAVGLVEWAQGLNSLMPVIQDTNINWPSIYAMAFCISSVALCIINFRAAADSIEAYRRRRPNWDATAEEVTMYIATKSVFGATFSNFEFYQSGYTLWTKIQQRQLRAVGRRPLSTELSKVTPKDTHGATVDIALRPNYYGNDEVGKFQVVRDTDVKPRKVVFDGVYLDWRDVKKMWPRKP